MPKSAKIAASLLVIAIIGLSFAGGDLAGGQTAERDEELDTVTQVWDIINSNYVDKDRIDSDALKQAAINGMTEALDDPYTSYLEKQDFQLSMGGLEGEFDGIGAYIGIKEEQLTIIAPMPGSPAAEAGIKAGDSVLEIDGNPTADMGLSEAALKIRGPEGTTVTLLIRHQDEDATREIEITRDTIELASVYFEMVEDIAYINIVQFTETHV